MDASELTEDLIFYRNLIKETLSYIEKGTPSKPWDKDSFIGGCLASIMI
jgi:hypothetical protein